MIEKEGPIHISNVMLVDPKDEQADPGRHRARGEGRRVRVAKRSGTEID